MCGIFDTASTTPKRPKSTVGAAFGWFFAMLVPERIPDGARVVPPAESLHIFLQMPPTP